MKQQIAQKDEKCDCCAREIPKGEMYYLDIEWITCETCYGDDACEWEEKEDE